MSHEAYASLFSEGVWAPEDVSEVSDSEGHLARIERDPSYPGAKRVYLDPSASDCPIQVHWSLPESASRPEFYPPDLPFIPGVSCRVTEGEDRLVATWIDDASARDPDRAEAIRTSIPEELSEFWSSMKQKWDEGRPVAPGVAERFKLFRDRFTDNDMPQWMASVCEGELEGRFPTDFENLLRQSVESGWSHESAEAAVPFAIKSASLRKGGGRRVLTLMAPFGAGTLVLSEGRVDLANSA